MTRSDAKEGFLLVLALATIPLLLLPLTIALTAAQETAVLTADITIWAIFAVDFFVGLVAARNRFNYLRTHWLDALIVLLPFLRPLRAVRVIRAARILVYGSRALNGVQRIASQRGFRPTLAIGIALLIGLALLTAAVESGSSGAIDNAGDAVWWAFVTATTVGYGDTVPVTTVGRALGIVTMLVGVIVFSAVTAFVTAYLVKPETKDDALQQLNDKIDRLEKLLAERVR